MAREIRVSLVGDEKDLARAFKASQGHADHFGKTMKTVEQDSNKAFRGILSGSGAFDSLGKSIAFASTAFLGAAGFTEVVKKSVEAGADLETQQIRIAEAFGKSADSVKAWSETTAKSIGLAGSESEKAAADVARFLKPIDAAPASLAKMSEGLVTVAANLAAAKGVKFEDALNALEQGLAGRGRSLKQFGITLDATTVAAEAMRLGLVKTNVDSEKVALAQERVRIATAKSGEALAKYGADSTQAHSAAVALEVAHQGLEKATAGVTEKLTAAQKMTASYSLVTRQAADTSGAFEEHSKTLAGQQKILHAEIKNVEERIGTALLPTFLKITTAATDWLGKTENLEKIQRAMNTAVEKGTTFVQAAWPVVQRLGEAVGTAAQKANDVVRAIGGWENAFKIVGGAMVLGKVLKLTSAFATLTGAGGATGIGGAGSQLGTLIAAFKRLPTKVSIPVTIALSIPALYGAEKKLYERVFGADFGGTTGGDAYPTGTKFGIDPRTGNSVPLSSLPASQRAAAAAAQDRAVRASGGSVGSTASPAAIGQGRRGTASTATAVAVTGYAQAHGPGSGTTYQWGGVSPQTGYDCSGYLYAAYLSAGVKIPRDTRSQWNDPMAVDVPKGAERPGDGVYFVGSLSGANAGPPPGHVGIYIGGGQFIEYYSSGKPARISNLAGRGDYMGARRWLKFSDQAGSSAPSAAPVSAASARVPAATTSGGGGGGALLHTAGPLHTVKIPTVGAAPLIPLAMANALRFAQVMTPGTGDDLRELKKQQTFLLGQLKRAGKNTQLYGDILDALGSVKSDIDTIRGAAKKTAAARKVGLTDANMLPIAGGFGGVTDSMKAALAKWVKQTLPRPVSIADANMIPIAGGFGAPSPQIIQQLQANAAKLAAAAVKAHKQDYANAWQEFSDYAMTIFDRTTQAHLQTMSRNFQKQMAAFNRETTAHLTALQKQAERLTPAEQALADMDAAAKLRQLREALEQARDSGDPKQIADAQQAIARDALETQATMERQAVNDKLERDTQAYNDERDAQAQANQDAFDAQAQAYQDQRDLDKIAYTETLKALGEHLLNRQATIQDANDVITALMAQDGAAAGNAYVNAMRAALAAAGLALQGVPGSATYGRAAPAALATAAAAGRTDIGGRVNVLGSQGDRILKFAAGGDFMVRSPQLIMVGEAGPERVQITPHGGSGGDLHTTLVVQLDGREVYRTVQTEALRDLARNGTTGIR